MKEQLISMLQQEWKSRFPDRKVFFNYIPQEYSTNYMGKRYEAVVHIKNPPKDIEKKQIASFCSKFNSDKYLIQF